MSQKPHFRILSPLEYREVCPKAAYWLLTKRIFGDLFMPRALYNHGTDTIYTTAKHANAHRLLLHEYLHAYDGPLYEHPTTIWAGLIHAAKCGFDCRAFTGILRWRFGPLKSEYAAWKKALVKSLEVR